MLILMLFMVFMEAIVVFMVFLMLVLMDMDPALHIMALDLASATEASKACHTTLAREMLMLMLHLMLMPMLMLTLMLTMVIMDMVLGLHTTHMVLPAVMLAQLFMAILAIDMDCMDTPLDISARGLLSLSPMVLLLLCTQLVLLDILELLPAMLVALSLVILVSIMVKGLPMLMLMLTLTPMLMLTMACMDTEDMDMGIQVAIPMSPALLTTVLMLMALAHTGAKL